MIYNKAFRDSDNFLLSILGNAPYGILAFEWTGQITIANALALELLNLPVTIDDLIESHVLDYIEAPDDLVVEINYCLSDGTGDFELESLAYANRYLTITGTAIKDGMILTINDVTSFKESEFEDLNSLLEGQEIERKRIAREIHDGIGPILSTLKLNLANIEGDLLNSSPQILNKFRESYKIIDQAANDLRSISHNLMPKVLDDFGLKEALTTLCENIQTSQRLQVDFSAPSLQSELDVVTELGLYRITQELINNTLKHAEASRISLQILEDRHSLRLLYEDNGKGFDPEKSYNGIGIMNIESRTKALAGELTIESQQNKGMTALIEIPL